MDRSARNLLYGLLLTIVLVGVGSGTFVLGLNIGRIESATPIPTRPDPTSAAPSTDSSSSATPIPTPASDGDIRPELEIFEEAYRLIQTEFYGEIPDDTHLAYGAVRGMLQGLGDQHTTFLEPTIAERERETRSGVYGGIGVLVNLSDSQVLEVVRVFKGTPADTSGLRTGDQIVTVDGRSISGLSLDEMIALVRGPANTDVTLGIERPDVEPFEVVVTRGDIEVPLVEARMIGSDVAYVSLTSFDARATEQLSREIETLLARNPKGLIFDLRGDPGGFLDQAIDVADLFLDDGLVMIERDRGGTERRFDSHTGDLAEGIPLVVLVDGGSASASEIVAGAIQDRQRGELIGTLTYGKGSVQNVHTLSDGSELRVTIARWFTPNDRAIHGQGLEPDLVVEPGEDADQDLQLDRAVEYLRTEP